MNARTPSLFLLAAAALIAVAAAPPALAVGFAPEDVRLQLETFVRDRLPASVEAVAVEDLNLDESIVVDGDARLRFKPRATEDFIGHSNMVLEVVQDRRVIETRNISFRICAQAQVWTTAVSVQRGQRIDGSLLTLDSRDLDTLPSDALLGHEAIDRAEAGRSLAVGAVLCRSMLRRLPDRARGTSARIVLTNGVLTVECSGQMMDDGFVGEYARARCGRTQKVIQGELYPGGYLLVELPGPALAEWANMGGGR